jgi:DNA-directed RNA polymerase subunit M/transcription elongation factor TFIIS
MPQTFQFSHIDPLFRHRLQRRFREVLGENESVASSYADALEMMLAVKCNFDAALYEERASSILYTLTANVDIADQYDPSVLVVLDDCALMPNSASLADFQHKREMRRASFDSLLGKLTAEVESDGYPSLQCRKCGGQADFNPLQIRSADEPMTIFCTCLNPRCKFQWKM